MKILHTADWHLGKWLGSISRLPEQKEVLEELCSIVEQENPDIVLIAGDIYDQINPDVIIHLAAVSHANRSNKDPHSTFDHSLQCLRAGNHTSTFMDQHQMF